MDAEEISDVLARWCAEVNVIGASAGVRRVDQSDVVAAWGLDGRNPASAMPTSGRFRIGSVTKTFTSAIVLDLIDRGVLEFESTIESWLPRYPYAGEITLRSLLEHTAGTADMIFDAYADFMQLLLSDLERRFTPAEIAELMASLPAHAPPGNSYRYSNTDYNLLGLITERVSGVSFSTLLSRGITIPLGLSNTAYDDNMPDDLLHGWFDLTSDGQPRPSLERDLDVRDFPNTALITLAFAAGGMTATVVDLLAWGESLYLGDVLTPTMRKQLLASPAFPDPAGGHHGLGVFGYGERSADGSWPAYGHVGNIVGSSTFVGSFPASHTTVAIHANVLEVPSDKLVDLGFALEATRGQP